jgi:hypothetical protein
MNFIGRKKELSKRINSTHHVNTSCPELSKRINSTHHVDNTSCPIQACYPYHNKQHLNKNVKPKTVKKKKNSQTKRTKLAQMQTSPIDRYPKYQLAIAHVRNFAAKVIDLPRKIFKILRMSHMGLT